MRTGLWWKLGMILLAGLVSAVLAAPPAARAAEPEKVLVGGLTALSGPAAPWGVGMQNCWQMVLDDINKQGGFTVNGKKYQWDLVVYDHAFDAAKAVASANRLITRDQVKIIFAFDGGMIKAYQPISEKAKVISIAWASPGKDYISPQTPYTWMYGIDCMAAAIFYPWIEKNTDLKKVALFFPDTWTGHATSEAAKFGLSKTKLEVVFDEFAPGETTDFYPALTRILATKPDLIDCANWDPAVGALLVKQARQLGFKGPMYLVTPDVPTLKDVAGWENCEGLYFAPYEVEETPAMTAFREAYIQKHGEQNWLGAIGFAFYDWPHWLTEAIEGAQSFDNDKVNAYLETMKTKSIYGEPAYFAGKGFYGVNRMPLYPFAMAQVQKGEIVQVIKNAFATYLE
ncbi:MAG: ABC transporter substrate-binding protein [Thermodesulfobacteriota bacterium]